MFVMVWHRFGEVSTKCIDMKIMMTIILLAISAPMFAQTEPEKTAQKDSTSQKTAKEPEIEKNPTKGKADTSPSWLYFLLPIIGK